MDTHNALQAMAAQGLAPDHLIADGRIHRFSASDDKRGKKNAWYICFDSPFSVTYGSWKDPDAKYTWRPDGQSEPTDEERERIRLAMEKRRADDAKRKRRNAARLAKVWANAQPADGRHGYLKKKHIKTHGIKRIGKRLLIAMRNSAREVVGLQVIYSNGFKRYAKGSQPNGSYYSLGKPNGHLYICEGFATGATVHELTGSAVAVAFSSGNLLAITKAMRAALPDTKLIICADNDRFTSINTARGETPNPGVYYATEASNATGAELRVPEFASDENKPTDFNDLALIEGNKIALAQLTGETTAPEQPASEPSAPAVTAPFKPLGYDHSGYYFLPRRTNQVTHYTASAMANKTNLLSLASLEWWEMMFPGEKQGIDWLMAANYVMRKCEDRGAYDPGKVRGRGAWFDEGRSVLHLGDRLLVDNETYNISDMPTRFIYQSAAPMENNMDAAPADVDQAKQVLTMFQGLSWDKSIHAMVLSGWCALAPICGALRWRPHVWITGQRGTGKSWIQHNMIEPLLGSSALMVQANSTEAGVRQMLQIDSRPVVFDEAEAESQQDKKRIQQVIELARQASSETTAEIAKGSSGGKAMTFRARSMFLMGSVNVNLSMASDESRFSVISLKAGKKTPEQIQAFKDTEALVKQTMSDEFCASIRSRMYHMIPIIRSNAIIFSQAVAEHIGSQRIGDQMGTLLAGVCALTSDDPVTIEQARAWITGLDFSDAEEAEQVSDEERCLSELLHAVVRTERGDKSIAKLIKLCLYSAPSDAKQYADETLLTYGLKMDGTKLHVSNTHPKIRDLLDGSPWSNSWARILARLEGATKPGTVRFDGVVSRATTLPISEHVVDS